MPAALTLAPTIHSEKIKTVNLGTKADKFGASEIGKAVKLIAPDTYGLCADGDKIQGLVTSSEYALTGATRGGLSVGGIVSSGYFEVVSTETLAFDDVIVAAAMPAVGTPLTNIGEGEVPALPVKKAAPGAVAPFLARIVGLGRTGSGDAGTICVAEFL